MMLTKDQYAKALKDFDKYFTANYPGPNTIIGDPHWHAPKIFRAALCAIETSAMRVPSELPTQSGCDLGHGDGNG